MHEYGEREEQHKCAVRNSSEGRRHMLMPCGLVGAHRCKHLSVCFRRVRRIVLWLMGDGMYNGMGLLEHRCTTWWSTEEYKVTRNGGGNLFFVVSLRLVPRRVSR